MKSYHYTTKWYYKFISSDLSSSAEFETVIDFLILIFFILPVNLVLDLAMCS